MKLNFIDFLNRMQTHKKFKQFVEGNFDVINELTSFEMEDATLVRIEASLVRTCATNEVANSHEFVGANEQE
jgi:hypothetical protein